MAEQKLSKELRHCLEDDECLTCDHWETETFTTCKGLLQNAYETVKRYEELEQQCNKENSWGLKMLLQKWKEFAEDIHELYKYRDLEKQGRLLKLPCMVGDAVYVLAECENIPAQLDGTLWDENGVYGTATGYYCPYENHCPFDDEAFEDCEKYKEKTAVFEDTVGDITIGEDGVWVNTVNCGVHGQIGEYVFLTRQEAADKLAEMEGKK